MIMIALLATLSSCSDQDTVVWKQLKSPKKLNFLRITKYLYRNPQNVNLAGFWGTWVRFYSILASASPPIDLKKRTLVPQNAYLGWLFVEYST
jgi:hypothetical protein